MNEETPATSISTVVHEQTSTVTISVSFQRQASKFFRNSVTLLLYLGAMLCAIYGNSLLRGEDISYREETRELAAGSPYLWIAVILWLFGDLVSNWQRLKTWWRLLEPPARARWLARIPAVFVGLSSLSPLSAAMSASPDGLRELLGDALGRISFAVLLLLLINMVNWRPRIWAAAQALRSGGGGG